MNDITLLSTNYNHKMMTLCMLKSYMKYCGYDAKYLIIDNSNNLAESLISYTELNAFDNTFNHITHNYGQCSKNHCSAIDYALKNLITTSYVLLCDNDVFFKSTIIELLKDYKSYDCIGQIGWDDAPPTRIFPYLNIINIDKMKHDKINYFDINRITELQPIGRHEGPRGPNTTCWYHDTGSSFYEDIKDKWNIKQINLNDYIVHHKVTMSPKSLLDDFINSHKEMWQ